MARKTSSSQKLDEFPHLQKEIALLKRGYHIIAGLDEAGRGAWAGPVVAAAVILPAGASDLMSNLAGLRDSKKLSPRRREELFEVIHRCALAVTVGKASERVVDKINVVGATRQAMQQALKKLSILPDYLLVDHLTLPDIDLPQESFPKADNISLTVAAASVVAKVTRDRMMVNYHQTYPGYAFERHKGYGTEAHRAAIAELGPCPIHRMSFAPLRIFSDLVEID